MYIGIVANVITNTIIIRTGNTYANTVASYVGEDHGFIEVPKEGASIYENFVVANEFIEW